MGRSRSRERHRHSHSRSRSRSRSRDKQQHSEGRRDSGRDTSRDRDRGHDRDRNRQWDRDGGGGGPRRPPAGPVSDEPPPIGSIHRGVVHTVKPFGVFVAIEGYRRHVLVHHSQVSEEVLLTRGDEDELKVKALEYAAPPGQRVWVKILEVSADQNQNGPGYRVHGSMRVVDQDSGADLDPTGQAAAAAAAKGGGGGRQYDEPPEVGTCHRGEVKRIEAYGVFVALQGFRKYGLVHASQVANYLEFSAEDGEAERKKAIGEVVELGQEVWVKVVEVGHDDRGPKIGCSMKLVDQADGTDLDPQNLRYRPRGEGGQGGPGGRAPVGANAGEVRGGAIDWGYLATRPDAFGSTGYDLLQDDPEEPGRPAAGGRGGGFPPPPQQQQQQQQQQHMPPVGRGRGAVVPAWMAQGPAAPGSVPHRDAGGSDAAAANLTVEEALRIVQAATAGKKKHKEKHKKHKKSSKHKHKKSSRKRRSRSRGRSSSSDSESDRGR
ncbi:hypothetical protein OEZ85_013166 [Tetradesmus obliquus]|uniref:S1 motif domain-containing protein n=1 Tax=Tetradesmus obliquus TaxID=3088 RepID=A0ABY8U576_TETOB|nr:hypothetical protein OEZ85_013166 [Tetradesmus obliquus]